MMAHPFTDKAKYMKYYSVGSVAFSIIFASLVSYAEGKKKSQERGFMGVFVFCAYLMMVIFSLGSIYNANKKLSLPGMSPGARSLVLKRFVSSIIIFLCSNLYIFAFSCFITFGIPVKQKNHNWWEIILKIMFYLQGVLGPLARLNEPAFRVVIVESIKMDLKFIFCIKKETIENTNYLKFLR